MGVHVVGGTTLPRYLSGHAIQLEGASELPRGNIVGSARAHAREAETKTRRVWRSAAAVSEMEFRNLQVM
jgi:hypothetical protein